MFEPYLVLGVPIFFKWLSTPTLLINPETWDFVFPGLNVCWGKNAKCSSNNTLLFLSNILDACDVGICGNPSNLMETTVEARNAASKQTHNENDDLQVKPTRSYIEEFHLDAKTNESFEQKQYKRGRSYTPSQRRRNRDDEEKDEDIRNRSFNVYNDDDQRDDDSRRRTRSTSHFEKKSKGSPKGKSKEKSRPTKGPRRKNSNNSDRDGTALPPLQPRSNSPKKN